MKKCLSLLIALSMIASLCVFPVSAETTGPVIPNGAILIFAEDFESGYDSGNLLATSNDVTVKKNDKSVLKLTAPAVDPNAYSAEITTAEAYGFDSNVLKLTNTSTSNNMNAYLYLNGNNAVDFTTEGSPYYGKQLVVEYDAYTVNYNENDFMRLDSTAPDKESTGNTIGPFMRASNSTFPVRNGAYNKTEVIDGVTYRPYYLTKSYTMTKPAKMKIVFDQTGDIDVNRSYMNGTLLTTGVVSETAKNGSRYKGKEVKDFVGEYFDVEIEDPEYKVNMSAPKLLRSVMRGKGGTAEAYIDNVVVYAVDSIEFDSITSKDSVAGNLEVNFTAPFNADVNTFKITDSTNADVDAIESVTMSADKKTAIIKLKNVEELTTYKVWVDDVFTSEAGAIFYSCLEGIDASNEYVEISTFKTAKTLVVEEAPEAIENLIPSDPRTFDIKFSAALASVTATLAGKDVTTQFLDENKTVRVKFTEITAGDLVISATGATGQVVTLTIPVTVATGVKGATIINDDLNSYAKGDFLAGLEMNTVTASKNSKSQRTSYNMVNGKFTINKWHTNSYYDTAAAAYDSNRKTHDVVSLTDEANTAKVEIVDNPNGVEGDKAMKISLNELYTALTVQRAYDVAPERGGVLVFESKYWFPDVKYSGLETGYGTLMFNGGVGYQRSSGMGNVYIAQGQWNAYPGGGNKAGMYSLAKNNVNTAKGQWVTITNVVDWTADATATRPDTIRTYVDGEAIPAYLYNESNKATDIAVYDLYDENYYGEYPVTGEIGYNGKTTIGTVAMPFYNIKATINAGNEKATEAQNVSYYVDDFKAYLAEDFTAEVVGNTTEYTPNQVVKILFNSQIPENQLAELYVVNKATGDKVEDATFTLANGGYAVDVKLPESVTKDEVYTVVAPTTFHDVTYQPLVNNGDWTFDITIGEYVSFKGEIDTTEINSFVSGKGETKATLTLSKAVNSPAGIVVKNAENAVVTEGWSASLSSDGKTIVLNFTNLPTANYTVDFAGLTAADGDAIVNANELAITITARINKIVLFDEDFEDDTEANWLTADYDTTKWGITKSKASAGDFVGVAAAPTDAVNIKGKALRMTSSGHLYAKALIRDAAGIDVETEYPGKVMVIEANVWTNSAADGTRILQPSYSDKKELTSYSMYSFKMSNNKTIKFEGSYVQPSDARYTSASAYHNGVMGGLDLAKDDKIIVTLDENGDLDTMKLFVNDKQFAGAENTYLTDHDLYGDMRYDFTPMSSSMARNAAINNGTVYGVAFDAYKADIYVDNLKVYLVDRFEIESIEGASTAFNMAKETVKINFTNKVMSVEDAAANIKLVDAEGNEVKDAIAVALTGNDYQVTVTLNEKFVTGSQEYTLVVSPAIRDEYGVSLAPAFKFYNYTSTGGTAVFKDKEYSWTASNGKVGKFNPQLADFDKPYYGQVTKLYYATEAAAVADGNPPKADGKSQVSYTMGTDFDANAYIYNKDAMKLKTVIKTAKATSLYAEATAAVVSGTNVSTSLTFTNPEEEALDVWYIVAAYGDYNEMIGCQAAALTVEKGSMDPIAVNFTTKSSDIKSVKVYVWDGYKTMVPYQEAEELLK